MKSLITLAAAIVLSQNVLAEDKATPLPAELSRADIAGAIFERADMTRTQHEDGHVTLDVEPRHRVLERELLPDSQKKMNLQC